MISRIVIFRRQYAQDMGFVFPSIRLHDAASLGTNQYVIRIRGEEVARERFWWTTTWLWSRRILWGRLMALRLWNRLMESPLVGFYQRIGRWRRSMATL